MPQESNNLNKLKTLKIEKENIYIKNPLIHIVQLVPFPSIKIQGEQIGQASLNGEETSKFGNQIEGIFLNLDGLVLTNLKFIRNAQKS